MNRAVSRGADQHLLAWDSSALHHAIIADRADVLLHVASAVLVAGGRHVTTEFVVDELAAYGLVLPAAVEVVTLSTFEELATLANWTDVMSASVHNRGEATVCSWAQVHQATVVLDDADARRVARQSGLNVVGSLRLIAEAINHGHETEVSASNLVDTLAAHGARYPFLPGGFGDWARRAGILG